MVMTLKSVLKVYAIQMVKTNACDKQEVSIIYIWLKHQVYGKKGKYEFTQNIFWEMKSS